MHDEAAAFTHVETMLWADGPVRPHCGVIDKAYRLEGVRTKPSRKNPEGKERHGFWKCRECRKQFTVHKGTIVEESHRRGGWSARPGATQRQGPRFATWETFNLGFEGQYRRRQADVLRGIAQRLARDVTAMSDLPASPFDACGLTTGRVTSRPPLSAIRTCPGLVESVQLTSCAFRSGAMGLWTLSDEGRLTGAWNPSIHRATAFSDC